MPDAKKEKRREMCRRDYHIAIENGCFIVARQYLRDSLIWRSPMGPLQSMLWWYKIRNGRLISRPFRWSY